jgi:hypothetical protein
VIDRVGKAALRDGKTHRAAMGKHERYSAATRQRIHSEPGGGDVDKAPIR